MRYANMVWFTKANEKRASELKWTERGYYVQEDADVAQKHVMMFLIQTIIRHFHFLVHTQDHMVLEGLVSIIL